MTQISHASGEYFSTCSGNLCDPLFLVFPPQCRGGRGRRLRAVPEERGGTRVSGGKAGEGEGTFSRNTFGNFAAENQDVPVSVGERLVKGNF